MVGCTPEAEVRGSNPLGRAIFHKKAHLNVGFFVKLWIARGQMQNLRSTNCASSLGAAAKAGQSPEDRHKAI